MLGLLARLDARDRRLFERWSLDAEASRLRRAAWIGVTWLGSAAVTIGLVVLPLVFAPWPRALTWRAGLALGLSHVVIQVIKRLVGRERPSERLGARGVIANPDRFSFPSGHATSSLALALSYAVAFPSLAAPLVGAGLLVGWSRVALGVHYPGDVLVGQTIAALTVLALR
ncbi:MAG: phosphatase PAP2 family protein [Gemmatimonadales bacterium]